MSSSSCDSLARPKHKQCIYSYIVLDRPARERLPTTVEMDPDRPLEDTQVTLTYATLEDTPERYSLLPCHSLIPSPQRNDPL